MGNKSFEDCLKGLENCSKEITKEDVSLEDAIKYYEEGMEHYKRCNDILNEAKQEVKKYEIIGDKLVEAE